MKRRNCFGLNAVVWMLAAVGVIVFFIVAPWVAVDLKTLFPEHSGLFWPGLAYVWAVAIAYYRVIFEFSRVVRKIAEDRSFSYENAGSMRRIRDVCNAVGIWFALGLSALFVLRVGSVRTVLLFVFLALVCFVISLMAHALSRLIARAADIKAENDLTV